MREQALSAEEAAALLGVHVETVRRLARRKEIPAFKVGKDWRFQRQGLERWMQRQISDRPTATRVLLIDDDPYVGATIRAYLAAPAYELTACPNGRSGLHALAVTAPDVVILDLKLPDIPGPDVLAHIRAYRGDLPVILLTGYPDSDLVRQALVYSPVIVLAKPAKQQQLLDALRMAIEH